MVSWLRGSASPAKEREGKRGPLVGVCAGMSLSEKRFAERGRETGLRMGFLGQVGWVRSGSIFFSDCFIFFYFYFLF